MKTAVAKVAVIVLLAIGLVVPVFLIQSLVAERQQRRDEALKGIAEGWGQRQTLAGPYVALPYERALISPVDASERTDSQVLHLPVENIAWAISVKINEKARGIYKARLYSAKLEARGTLRLPARTGLEDGKSRYKWGAPRLVIAIDDPRGIRSVEPVSVGGRRQDFAPGSGDAARPGGLHVPLPELQSAAAQSLDFSFSLELGGSETFALAPLGADSTVSMRADWPHPSFQGRYLPGQQSLDPQGFEAEWKVSRLAAQSSSRPASAITDQMVVSFIEPASLYQRLERASKYGFLFIGLTFAAFLLVELLARLSLHPVQYTLVGLALAMFFLLLTALSEHIAFSAAYAIAATACVGLVSAYLVRVLGSARLGLGFGAALAALYAVLYALLKAEDYSLLGGSLLLFGLLAAAMIGTWRVDWYRLTERRAPAT
jgi:inner membrane protein